MKMNATDPCLSAQDSERGLFQTKPDILIRRGGTVSHVIDTKWKRIFPNDGSSPRVRGTRHGQKRRTQAQRIIPACAGNASVRRVTMMSRADHPRVCGERGRMSNTPSRPRGSSPRVRGTLARLCQTGVCRRIIPACAGNASTKLVILSGPPDHPRVCGERPSCLDDILAGPGSSPRVRGTPQDDPSQGVPMRIIPACAGNATQRLSESIPWPDHPRVCGERSPCAQTKMRRGGSSPRVRGTQAAIVNVGGDERIIPACAGNASRGSGPVWQWPDHPRVCGERGHMKSAPVSFSGSSPRVRGTLSVRIRTILSRRIIPACAGNAADISYPEGIKHGSSPRVRGTQGMLATKQADDRIIPACAGNAD